MDKDTLIREYHNRAGTWQAMLLLYGILVGAMLLSASMIL